MATNRGLCSECGRERWLAARGLCAACYDKPEIREQYPSKRGVKPTASKRPPAGADSLTAFFANVVATQAEAVAVMQEFGGGLQRLRASNAELRLALIKTRHELQQAHAAASGKKKKPKLFTPQQHAEADVLADDD